MSKLERFGAYAEAFEKAFASDDWSVVEPFFAEDIVYAAELDPPFGGVFEGRPAVLAYMKSILDRLDRRFESRELALLDGPKAEGDSVWLRGSATYRAHGVPDFVIELEETAWFEGDRIKRLEDHYEPAALQQITSYLKQYGSKLGISLEDQPASG
jgi:hypothetical protein